MPEAHKYEVNKTSTTDTDCEHVNTVEDVGITSKALNSSKV